MIFLSHNYKDKPIVEPIANLLSEVFGRDSVFYDSWSIQPGDGIIEKMNEGLEKFKYFFFFISKNSLSSNMVKLEWQNALYKTINSGLKLIPVKLDDCLIPAILLQSIYIDIFGKGMDYGVRQIVDVVNNTNTYNNELQTYENLRGYVKEIIKNKHIILEVRAETYLEPISRYVILVKNLKNEIDINVPSEILMPTNGNFLTDINIDGKIYNGLYFYISRPTVPNYPIRFDIRKIADANLEFHGVLRSIGENKVRLIPISYI